MDAVVLAGQHGRDHTYDAFATYLGHQTANSGAFRSKLASLRDWGLITRGTRDRVTLSGLAEELVLAAPEHYEAKQLLLTAFESCRVFGMLYNDSAKSVIMDVARLRSTALMRYGVAPDQVDKFVESFVNSAVFARLAESDGTKLQLHPRDTVFGANTDPEDDNEAEAVKTSAVGQAANAGASAPMPTKAVQVVPIALRQAWPIEGGEIEFVIRTAKAMPPQIYALMAELAMAAGKMERLLQTASTPPVSPLVEGNAAQD